MEAKLNEYVKLEVYGWDDNKGDTEFGGRLQFNFAFGNPLETIDAFRLSDEPFVRKDLSKEVLIPVEREFDIIVEKYKESGGLVIEAGRT